jgi:hypothetical protein
MSFVDVEESRVRPSVADEAVVGREEDREAATVEILGVSRRVECWKASEAVMVT